jgi:hypothetical protein
MFGFFKKKKPKKYAVAKLVDNLVDKEELQPVSPLLNKAPAYIKYIGALKQAMVSRNVSQELFFKKYLKKNGLTAPNTLKDCDDLIERIGNW